MDISIISLILGIVNFIFSISITVPQLFFIFKTKNTSGTSLLTYIFFVICECLWITWSLANYFHSISSQSLEMIEKVCNSLTATTNVMSFLLSSTILVLKIKNLLACKKLKITELQLSSNLLKKDMPKNGFQIGLILIFEIAISIAVTTLLLVFAKPLSWSKQELDNLELSIMIINFIAAVSWEVTSWPQLVKIYKTHDTTGLSIGWSIFFSLTCIEVFFYDLSLAFIDGDFYKYLGCLIFNGMIVNTWILVLKIRNVFKAKKAGLSEIEYTKKYSKEK